jgi:hypothetical protein
MQVLNEGINNLWPTPVYKTKIDESLCNRVLDFLLQQENNFQDYANGNKNLFYVDNPSMKDFRQEVIKIFTDYFDKALGKNLAEYNTSYKAWATGKPGTYSMATHNHSGSPFVSVFYLYAQEKDLGGELVLNDPRVNANRGYTEDFQEPFRALHYKPITGDVLVFPGYLYHAVNPFMSDLRIAVPVDLFLDGKDIDEHDI